MTENLTPWQATRDVNYLAAVDLRIGADENDKLVYGQVTLTIKEAKMEEVLDVEKDQKKDKLVISFMEPGYKPMVLNTTNKKAIERATGTPFIERWAGKKIKIYVEKGMRMPGTKKSENITVDALRVSPVPAIEMTKCDCCGKELKKSWYDQSMQKYGFGVCSETCKSEMLRRRQEVETADGSEDTSTGTETA